MLFQLSYTPVFGKPVNSAVVVGQRGFEPLTSRLSGGRSNQLSYWPVSRDVTGLFGEGMTLPYSNYYAVKALFLIV